MKAVADKYNEIIDNIDTFKVFLRVFKNIRKKKYISDKDIKIIKDNYYLILFLICNTYMTDNMEQLYKNSIKEWPKTIFLGNEVADDYNPGLFFPFEDTKSITDELITNQFFEYNQVLIENPIDILKIFRNHFAHYSYTIDNNIIKLDELPIDDIKFGSVSFSIESLILLEICILSSSGQSYKSGTTDIFFDFRMGKNTIDFKNSSIIIFDKVDDAERITTSDLVNIFGNYKLYQKEEFESNIKLMKLYSKIDDFPEVNKIMNSNLYDGFIYRMVEINDVVVDYITCINKNAIRDDYLFKILFECDIDDIKRSSFSFRCIVGMLYLIKNDRVNEIYDIYHDFLGLIDNYIFITYMSLVFNDIFIKNFHLVKDSIIFNKLNAKEQEKIEKKFRNSLMHCRYRFENVFDDSKGIIIEFWDEDVKNNPGIKNFECEITKINAINMINDYYEYIKKAKEV